MLESLVKSVGAVNIQFSDGRPDLNIPNKVLRSGRIALCKAISNNFGGNYEYFISSICWGNSGAVGGVPRYIDDTRTGLFGATLLSTTVISSIPDDTPYQVCFTTVLTYDQLVGESLNEVGLRFHSGDFFSLCCFADINKTSSIQLTLNWRVSLV